MVLLFKRWDTSNVKVEDPGLRKYINLRAVFVPWSAGRFGTDPIQKRKVHIVERFINKLQVPGHRGKRHKLTSGHCSGRTATLTRAVIKAFEIIEKKTKQNPVQVLVKAVENAAALEEVAAYRLGGIIARKAVITSPKRRLDIALRHLAQGIYKKTFSSKIALPEAIAEELILAYNNDPKCFAIAERIRLEKEAEGAR